MMANTTTSPSACPIKETPVEIVLLITEYLTTPELGRFRLSCKAIEDKIWNFFVEEFFSRKQFMLSPFSLRALIDISQSRLADKVRCLQIGTDYIQSMAMGHLRAQSVSIDSYLEATNAYAAQAMLLSTGKQVRLLAEAMRNLPNLDKVVVRDFNSIKRQRDIGDNAQWKSYGATTAAGTGASVTMGPGGADNFAGVVFNSVMSAMGEAGVIIRSFEHMSRGGSMYDDSFAIDLEISPEILPVLQGFRKFHICLTLRGNVTNPWAISNLTSTHIVHDGAYHYRHFMQFLSHMPNLRDLRINSHNRASGEVSGLLEWLALPVQANRNPDRTSLNGLPPGLPSPVGLERLEELSLGFIAAQPESLLSVIAKFASQLRRLELWKVSLPALPRLSPPSPDDPKTAAWKPFMKRLLAIPNLQLHEIMIGCMQERDLSRHTWSTQVRFIDTQSTKHYKGSDWKAFVEKKIIPFIGPSEVPERISTHYHVSDVSGDSDDSMDDDADEDNENNDDGGNGDGDDNE